MGGKSRKSGGISRKLIAQIKAGNGTKCNGTKKPVKDETAKPLFD